MDPSAASPSLDSGHRRPCVTSSSLRLPSPPSEPLRSARVEEAFGSDPTAERVAHGPAPAPSASSVLETRPLRIAVLLNSYRSRLLLAIRGSYQRTIGAVAPHAQLAFYEPANRPGEFPNLDYFGLIVLGGSNVDPRKRHPWILEVHDFVRRLVLDYPHKKLLGICWGHQTISTVFGGEVVDAAVPEKRRIATTNPSSPRSKPASGKQTNFGGGAREEPRTAQANIVADGCCACAPVRLTAEGREFFHEASVLESFQLQQHHRREVAGHPEKDAETARLRLHDSIRWFGFDAASDEKAWARLVSLIDAPHDGEMVWRRIFE
ncbi:class I glutamine amidotransferase-like protein [Xylaria palmicola]|nr:class I glutamine amidotransferase-like protein [Xylaria palmicola]